MVHIPLDVCIMVYKIIYGFYLLKLKFFFILKELCVHVYVHMCLLASTVTYM
jgi:hypothetical protein